MDSGVRHRARPHASGFALMTVAVCLALMTVLLAAMFSIARTEREGAAAYQFQRQAALLADLSASLVVQQLRAGTSGVDQPSGEAGFWAAQPGVVRRYAMDGRFVAARKLYSSGNLVHLGSEAALLNDHAPSNWADQPHRWVDLNQPVVRQTADGTIGVHHPVIDPRAAVDDGPHRAVAGFSYQSSHPGGSVDGVIAPGQGAPDELRLPLPVEWLYVLADGTLGSLDNDGTFRGAVVPSADNPITGRIAFWADDETSKLPVNSASAPTYFATPSIMHGGGPTAQDRWWARAPPATGEFQRFPGHPATTSLLPVLAPGVEADADNKGLLYGIVPKLAHVGTLAGTVELDGDPVPWHSDQAAAERLYVSTDEFLLREDRQPNPLDLGLTNGGWTPADSARLLQRAGFFLSAIGRAPDYTLHGTPRVAMWPVHVRPEARTVFDQLIARCGSLGGRPFHFQRERHDHATHDIGLPRNRALVGYLEQLAQRPAPGYGAALADKYPADTARLVTSLFDYIRTTNLYDGRLEHETLPNLSGQNATYPRLLTHLPASPDEFNTYTPGRFAGRTQVGYHNLGFGLYPGHGQVLPSQRDGHTGFGRVYSLGEVSALFIACADGTANEVNPYRDSETIDDPWRGGFAVRRTINDEPDQTTILYSNFPPEPGGQRYGADQSHPGYQPVNWNLALEPDTPLDPNVVRVQSTLLMDWFSVAGGYTILRGHFGVRVRGLSHLGLEGSPLYPQDEVFVRPYWDAGDAYHNGYRGGGDADVRGWLRQRKLPARGTRPADNGYNNPGAAGLPSDLRNYDLVSNYIDVEGETMEFTAAGPVEIELLAPDAEPGDPPLQTFVIRFPASSVLPRPRMNPTTNHGSDNAQSNVGSFYWSLHADGFNGSGFNNRWDWRGRLWELLHIPGGYGAIFRHHGDIIASMMPWHGDFRLTAGRPLVAHDPASPYEVDGMRWEFVPHEEWPQGGQRGGHNIMARHAHWWARYYHGPAQHRLFPGAWGGGFAFKFPNSPAAAAVAHRYGDFDNGPGNLPAGALINKPDEGDFHNRTDDTPYFSRNWMFDEYTAAYFSPNRMVSSPVMFGSLPARVIDPDPWRTLLFRPQAVAAHGQPHPGAAAEQGGVDPPDHVLLDWFRMPVVEPYAISDGASSGGKVNLNHQILPFRHVRRATALHGLLGDELIPKVNASNHGWHVPLDVDAVLAQMDDRLGAGRLFTSVGQFCEIHLPPQPQSAHGDPAGFVNTSRPVADRMADFWSHYRGTADNLRERPYANLVPRMETRSNSWTVHCRVQVIRLPRGADPARVTADEVRVLGEYRGSMVVERFIDPDDPALPDHAAQPSAPSLDTLHQFRIHSARRFAP